MIRRATRTTWGLFVGIRFLGLNGDKDTYGLAHVLRVPAFWVSSELMDYSILSGSLYTVAELWRREGGGSVLTFTHIFEFSIEKHPHERKRARRRTSDGAFPGWVSFVTRASTSTPLAPAGTSGPKVMVGIQRDCLISHVKVGRCNRSHGTTIP